MRKLLLYAVLASLLCSTGIAGASDAVPSEAISGFGLLKVYSTDHPVILRADGEPYYSNVTKFVGRDYYFAVKLKNGYSDEMSYGTLTVMNSGLRYRLTPGGSSEKFCSYNVEGSESLSDLAGQKVMWNLYTSPDVIVGAAVIPENVSALSLYIAEEEIMPYVKINHNSSSSSIGRVDVYFVRSGDSKPAALGDSVVMVYVNKDMGYYYPSTSYEFTNFNKPVRNSFYLGYYESELHSLTVEYEKGGARYIWNFVPEYGSYSSIERGKLELENQPLTLKTGEAVDIEIKLPAGYDLAEGSSCRELDFL